jgi:acyl-CoA synthetase (NDP forming)/GNAT superfamily N-acetyltransferase
VTAGGADPAVAIAPDSDALLTDARIVHIRPAISADRVAVEQLHARLSDRTIYLRYFGAAPNLHRYIGQLLRPADDDHETLLATLGGTVVGMAGYERLRTVCHRSGAEPGPAESGPAEPDTAESGPAEPDTAESGPAEPDTAESGPAEPDTAESGPAEPDTAESGPAEPDTAEVAFLVDDAYQGLGIGMLLLEHLAAAGAGRGVRRFVAETLPDNAGMLSVFRDSGFAVSSRYADGVVHVEFSVVGDERARSAADAREGLAEFRSVDRLLRPESVAVVGAGADPAGLGHQLLCNVVAGGFPGPVYPINGAGEPVAGLPAYRSLTEVSGPVDLVVVAVPAPGVLPVARDAAARGARNLVVISAGFAEASPDGAERQEELLALCRSAGMRLVGPNCMGIVSRVDGLALNATFCPTMPPPGGVGLMSQSGAVGIAALGHAARTGVGLSSFVSAGNKADISGNDLLCFWERDPGTTVCALYLESFGNPRKFARIARRVAASKPVVAVKAGRSPAGSRGARSHTAAAATPDVVVDALFAQAGVIRAESLSDLLDLVAFLECGPLPAGNRVAVVGNSGGPGVMAADACVAAGLEVPALAAATRVALSELLPAGAAVGNPVDLLAGTGPEDMGAALRTVLTDEGIDSVIAVYTPVLAGSEEPAAAAIAAANGGVAGKPVVAVVLDSETPAALRRADGRPLLACYPFPETAARVLGAAARYQAWRRLPPGSTFQPPGIDELAARRIVEQALRDAPAGCWLPADVAVNLVEQYGVRVVPTCRAASSAEAVAAADRIGWPVVVKAAAGELVHKTDLGAVRVGLSEEAELTDAFAEMASRLGDRMGGAVVQPVAAAGVETVVGVTGDPSFGPLLMFGLGGVASDLLADRALRILPVTREEVAAQVRALRSSPLLFGYRGSRPVDVGALEDLLLRVARIAEDLPEVAELDLNPVLARPDGVQAVDVKVRLAPAATGFPLLRRLPT